ncbi:MAG: amidohydrolase [Thermoplasmata archaeon]
MSLVIKNCSMIDEEGEWDVKIKDGEIAEIGEELYGSQELEGKGKYLSPGMVNTHTHGAMTLLRGYADDLPLDEWLQDKIWPLESKLTAEDVYWGTKLACLEMIKSGTVAFNDMYFFMESAARAVEDMGMKATLSYGFIDMGDKDKLEKEKQETLDFIDKLKDVKNVRPALGPHATYTVSREGLQWCAEISRKKNIPIHIHLAETEKEIKDHKKEHGVSVTEYLDRLDVLTENTTAAHCVWLNKQDIERLAQRDVVVSHCPISNMKLGVGKAMDYRAMKNAGVRITLGTDGCASNNNLDMFEEVKAAALLHKLEGDTTLLPAEEAYQMATRDSLNTGGGAVEVGKSADLILIKKGVPDHDIISDMVYLFSGYSVTDTIVDGRVLMRDRRVEGEELIKEKAYYHARKLVSEVL